MRSKRLAWIAGAVLILIMPMQRAVASEPSERKAIHDEVAVAWYRNDVAMLQQISEEWRSSKARAPSGAWKLALFYQSMKHIFESGNWGAADNSDDDELLDGWQRTYPASATPRILKALVLMRRGANARKYAAEGRPPLAGWQPEIEQFKSAQRTLEDARGTAAQDPHWYAAMIQVLFEQRADVAEILTLHHEALTAHPEYDATHAIMMTGLLSLWAPNMAMIEKFAQTVRNATRDSAGDIAYARLYMHVYHTYLDAKIFHRSAASWEQMKSGLQHIVADYPVPWNVSHLALFSCIFADHAVGAKAFAALGPSPVRDVWKQPQVFEACRRHMTIGSK